MTTKAMRNTIFDYHMVLREVMRQKSFVLENDEPCMLIPPFALMPRNFSSKEDECLIRFHSSTSYPWDMTLINTHSVATFLAGTTVIPMQQSYSEWIYDIGLQKPNENPSAARNTTSVGKFNIPLANDYGNMVFLPAMSTEPEDRQMRLPAELISMNTPRQDANADRRLCDKTIRGMINFVSSNDNEFLTHQSKIPLLGGIAELKHYLPYFRQTDSDIRLNDLLDAQRTIGDYMNGATAMKVEKTEPPPSQSYSTFYDNAAATARPFVNPQGINFDERFETQNDL